MAKRSREFHRESVPPPRRTATAPKSRDQDVYEHGDERAAREVDRYLKNLDYSIVDAVTTLRNLVIKSAPRMREAMKWGHLTYRGHRLVLYLSPAKDHLSLGFYWGASLDDPRRLLEGSGPKLRHVKLGLDAAIPAGVVDLIRAADLHDRTQQSLDARTRRRR